jgi:hypothetical protein
MEVVKEIKNDGYQTTDNTFIAPAKSTKDVWDKLAAIGPIISGILVFTIGGYFTYTFNEHQLQLQEVQTIEKFLPHLGGDEQSKRAAILAISSLTNTTLASKLASIYASAGTASALQSMAQSGTEKDKTIATQALATTLEKIAENQTQIKDIQEELKSTLAQSKQSQIHNVDLDLPASLNKLAEYYVSQGQYNLAEPLLLRYLSLQEQTAGSNSLQIADILKNLSDFYKLKGDTNRAEHYLTRAREITQKSGLGKSDYSENSTTTDNGKQAIGDKGSNFSEKNQEAAIPVNSGELPKRASHSLTQLAGEAEGKEL